MHFRRKAASLKVVASLCAACFAFNADASPETSNPYSWLSSTDDVTCDAIPAAEWEKFASCRLLSKLKIDRRQTSDPSGQPSRFEFKWRWLEPVPVAVCSDVPEREQDRFGCSELRRASKSPHQIRSELQEKRNQLTERHDELTGRRQALNELNKKLPTDRQVARLKDLRALEAALQTRRKKIDLIRTYSATAQKQPQIASGTDTPTSVAFAQLRTNATVFKTPRRTGPVVGTLQRGTMVLVLKTSESRALSLIFSQETAFGYVRTSLVRTQ